MKSVLRRLARSPMFAVITLITLAIGIGANTAIFSVVNGVLLKPLPFPHPEQLVGVWETTRIPGLNVVNASPATYFTFREESRTFQDSGAWRSDSVSVTGNGEPERVDSLSVTDGTLPVLGIQPVRGRWFTRKDDAPASSETAMLTYGYWQRKFGGDSTVIGRRIMIDGKSREIVGVMPQSFRFMDRKFELILPLQLDRGKTFIGNFSYLGIARLKPGITLAQANADEARMLPMMQRKFAPFAGMSMQMVEEAHFGPNLRPLAADVVGDTGKMLWVLMGTIGVVLLIAAPMSPT